MKAKCQCYIQTYCTYKERDKLRAISIRTGRPMNQIMREKLLEVINGDSDRPGSGKENQGEL